MKRKTFFSTRDDGSAFLSGIIVRRPRQEEQSNNDESENRHRIRLEKQCDEKGGRGHGSQQGKKAWPWQHDDLQRRTGYCIRPHGLHFPGSHKAEVPFTRGERRRDPVDRKAVRSSSHFRL